jgi:hypothetical protein
LGLDISHWKTKSSMTEILVKNSPYSNSTVKRRIIQEGVLKYECSQCSEGNLWSMREDGVLLYKGNPVVLQLDHVNGDNRDNRVENLRFLCGTCHSQTDTFTGKNCKKVRALAKWATEGTARVPKRKRAETDDSDI